MKWAYGVTSVSSRLETTLPKTLASLEKAGFDNPHLFIDDADTVPDSLCHYPHTTYCPKLNTFGNWVISAWSIYVRNPLADMYAIFQDDLVTYVNLREFLDRSKIPNDVYLNCYTFPSNEKGKGWHLSNQRGLGAVALVFPGNILRRLLATEHMVNRPLDANRGHKAVDGGIVTALKKVGVSEYVHSPSLTQHIGVQSSMGNKRHPKAVSFRGENFNALELL